MPLPPRMLRGVHAAAWVQVSCRNPDRVEHWLPQTDAASLRRCCLDCSLGCRTQHSQAHDALPAAVSCPPGASAATCEA